ncbi:MAG: hypothetical protein PVI07_19800 [Anaerolineae bacterium]|jgi:hypothetical protein
MKEEERTGTVVLEEGKYFLEVAGERQELPPGFAAEEQLKELAGREVGVLYSEPKRFVVGLVDRRLGPIICYLPIPPIPPIPCYIPPPWVFRGIEKQVRINLADRFLEEGYISEEVYEKLI